MSPSAVPRTPPMALSAPTGAMSPSAARSATADIVVLTDWAAFQETQAAWDELVVASGAGIFMEQAWLNAWWDAYGAGFRPHVVQVWRSGRLIAGAPLALRRRPLIHRRVPILSVVVLHLLPLIETGFDGWLLSPDAPDAADLLLHAIIHRIPGWHMLEAEPLPDSPASAAMCEALRKHRLAFQWSPTIRSQTIDLSQGWETALAARPRSVRKNLRVSRQRIEEAGGQVITDANPALTIDRLLALSARSWKARAGTGLGSTDGNRRFYETLWQSWQPAGRMSASLLEIGGTDVASFLTVRDTTIVFGLKTEFDEAYSRLSPGRFLIAHAIEVAAKTGARLFDSLRANPLVETLAGADYSLYRLRVFRTTNRARLFHAAKARARPIALQWRRRLRERLHRRRGFKDPQ